MPTRSEIALAVTPLIAGSAIGAATTPRGLSWYRRLDRPTWTPPDAAFGPAWTILYLLQGLAAVLVLRVARRPDAAAGTAAGARSPGRAQGALALFGIQLGLNLLWSVIFFGLRAVRPAGIELTALWAALVATVVAFWRVRVAAGALLLPYLAWTTFAGLLNAALIRRNPGA